MDRIRLDVAMTGRGLAPSRSRAQAMIAAGCVLVDGKPAEKPGMTVSDDAVIAVIAEDCPYVSRGGLKLEKALREFGIDPTAFVCSDSGASTGGFTDCLLQKGAEKVFVIDVGTGQLADQLRNDPRVVVMEQTNIRYLTPEDFGTLLDLSVVDVSFISLRTVLPTVRTLLKPTGQIVCLIKPQFEAGREHIGKKGVVKDPKIHTAVLRDFMSLGRELGMTLRHLTFSPVRGPEGNIEFLGHLSMQDVPAPQFDPEQIVRAAHAELTRL